MNPKQKANQLFLKFIDTSKFHKSAKKAAIICVNEIIEANTNFTGLVLNGDYWEEVKQEIDKL